MSFTISVSFAVLLFLNGPFVFGASTGKASLSESIEDFTFNFDSKPEPAMTFETPKDEDGFFASLKLTNRKIATVAKGPMKGAELILAKFEEDAEGPCSPPLACKSYGLLRFLKTDKKISFLKKASLYQAPWEIKPGTESNRTPNKSFKVAEEYKRLGLDLMNDDNLEIPGIYAKNEIIFDNNSRKNLQFIFSTDELKKDHYQIFRIHPVAGKVFTLKPGQTQEVQILAYDKIDIYGANSNSVFMISNRDQTYSVYGYAPDIYNGNKISKKLPYVYTHIKLEKCGAERPDQLLDVISDQSLSENQMVVLAKTENGDNLYLPPDKMLKDLYSYYEGTKSEYFSDEEGGQVLRSYYEKERKTKITEPESLKEFKKMNPMVLWKNPFDQWMGFVRVRFLKPGLCD